MKLVVCCFARSSVVDSDVQKTVVQVKCGLEGCTRADILISREAATSMA